MPERAALLPRPARRRARARSAPAGRRPAVDRELGLDRRASRASRGRATAGSRPPTTRRRSGSPPHAPLARALEDAGGTRTASPTRSRRCGPGCPRIARRRDRVLADVLAPLLRRDPDELRAQVCVGPAEHCAELLVALRRGRLRARLPVAAGRRGATARAGRGRSGAVATRTACTSRSRAARRLMRPPSPARFMGVVHEDVEVLLHRARGNARRAEQPRAP